MSFKYRHKKNMNPYGRPKKTEEEKGVQISIRLPKTMLERLDLESKYIGRSAFIRKALAELFESETNESSNAVDIIKRKRS